MSGWQPLCCLGVHGGWGEGERTRSTSGLEPLRGCPLLRWAAEPRRMCTASQPDRSQGLTDGRGPISLCGLRTCRGVTWCRALITCGHSGHALAGAHAAQGGTRSLVASPGPPLPLGECVCTCACMCKSFPWATARPPRTSTMALKSCVFEIHIQRGVLDFYLPHPATPEVGFSSCRAAPGAVRPESLSPPTGAGSAQFLTSGA